MSRINRRFNVPTGDILIVNGEKGKLECLSIGDYGKEKNLKADFLGLQEEINGVPHGDLLPLEEKWVITISSQYGCSMNCSFCDVPKVGPGANASFMDLKNQLDECIGLHEEITETKRLNLHYARMGEPTFNYDVISHASYTAAIMRNKGWGFHPVVSTMMPKGNKHLQTFLEMWLELKYNLGGEAGLQLSVNTTDWEIRSKTMPCSMHLIEISDMMKDVIAYNDGVEGRKITLNFALTEAEIDAGYLRKLFDPQHFICKITPMHKTKACVDKGLITDDGYDLYYPYKEVEESLKEAGFDVIVFIPSKEEDESRITCGNALLASKE